MKASSNPVKTLRQICPGKWYLLPGYRNVFIRRQCQYTRAYFEAITLPFSTMQQTYNLGKKLHVVCFIMKPGVKVKDVQPEVERLVKAAHYIAPDDKQAVMLLNAEAMFSMMDNLMIGVRFLIWMVGLGTLFAGAIGVSNIMMVTVKERTTEIGIRRAIGARPKDILQQILSESMVLTTIAGMAGISFAVFVLQILEKLPPMTLELSKPTTRFHSDWLSEPVSSSSH